MIVDHQLGAAVAVAHLVRTGAKLAAGTPVGRTPCVVQAQVTFARYSHAQGTVRKHLDPDRFSSRTANIPLTDTVVNSPHLRNGQLACQHHHICELGVKSDRFQIRQVQLRRDMHFKADRPGIKDTRLIRNDHGGHSLGPGPIHRLPHGRQIRVVKQRIDSQIRFNVMPTGNGHDTREIVQCKIRGRTRAHIQLPDAEIDRIGPGINGGPQRLIRADRRHDLYILAFETHFHPFSVPRERLKPYTETSPAPSAFPIHPGQRTNR